MAETRYGHYKGIVKEDGKMPKIVHDLDQLVWYRDAKVRNLRNDSSPDNVEQLLSAVRFQLPYVAGKTSPSYLMVVGEGLSICNVYLARTKTRDLLTGRTPEQGPVCWEVFSYTDAKKDMSRDYSKADDKELEMSLPSKFGQIFTTDVAPFLKGADYPHECDRVYEISPSCISFDKIRIVAENRENRNEQNLNIIWVPDKRDGKEREIVSFNDLEWCTKDFDSTFDAKAFTFTNPTNALC